MKNIILSILVLVCPLLAQADCNPVTFEGCFCSPSTPEGCAVEKPYMPLFASHLDAEGNYYHMLEGLAILTLEIQKRLPKFQGFPLSIFVDRQYQDCSNAPGQIYSQEETKPEIGVCFVFNSQKEAEDAYSFGVTTYYQYWNLLQELIQKEKGACRNNPPPLKDGANKGNLSKPTADPGARCKDGWTVLLDSKYKDVKELTMLASSQIDKGLPTGELGDVGHAEYFGFYQNSRPRFCFRYPGSRFGANPVYLSFTSNGKEQCLKVSNASQRED